MPRDEARVKAREEMVGMNWRSRPLGKVFVHSERRPQGKCHRLPRRESLLSVDAIAGVRRRAATVRDATTKVVRTDETSRRPSHARIARVSGGVGEHSRFQAGSCYCELVWWIQSGRFRTRNVPPKGSGFASGTRKRRVPSRIERRPGVSRKGGEGKAATRSEIGRC